MSEFYGKYRAKVVNVEDPEFRGRIKILCPKVYGEFESPWCLPCTPYALDNKGFLFVPKLNEMIWVEFEEGDPSFPIWVGGLWQEKSTPLPQEDYNKYIEEKRLMYTESGHKVTFCDKDGEKYIEIEDAMGSKIHFDSETGDVTITAIKDFIINAGGDIVETATGKHTSKGSQVHHN